MKFLSNQKPPQISTTKNHRGDRKAPPPPDRWDRHGKVVRASRRGQWGGSLFDGGWPRWLQIWEKSHAVGLSLVVAGLTHRWWWKVIWEKNKKKKKMPCRRSLLGGGYWEKRKKKKNWRVGLYKKVSLLVVSKNVLQYSFLFYLLLLLFFFSEIRSF